MDLVTLVWLSVFFVGFVASLGEAAQIDLLALLPVYVADLGVRYRRVGNLRRFLWRIGCPSSW